MEELEGERPLRGQVQVPFQAIQGLVQHMALQGQLLDLGLHLLQFFMVQFFAQAEAFCIGHALDFFQAQAQHGARLDIMEHGALFHIVVPVAIFRIDGSGHQKAQPFVQTQGGNRSVIDFGHLADGEFVVDHGHHLCKDNVKCR